MKNIPNFLTIALLLFLPYVSFGQADFDPSKLPADQWQSYPEGVAFAYNLKKHENEETKGGVINIFIKNISSTPKIIFYDSLGRGFKCLISDNNKWSSLKNIDKNIPIIHASSVAIKNGQIVVYPMELNASELQQVKSHMIKFEITIVDEATKKQLIVDTNTVKLAELP